MIDFKPRERYWVRFLVYPFLTFYFFIFIILLIYIIYFIIFYSLLFFLILLGMDSKCFLTSTDLQTHRARCQHQLSFLFHSARNCAAIDDSVYSYCSSRTHCLIVSFLLCYVLLCCIVLYSQCNYLELERFYWCCWQVLVRRNGCILLYCKGADSTVYPCLHPSCQTLMDQTADHMNVRQS